MTEATLRKSKSHSSEFRIKSPIKTQSDIEPSIQEKLECSDTADSNIKSNDNPNLILGKNICNSEISNITVSKNRGPGRPRKTPIRKPKPRCGIVLQPTNESNFLEFIYDKPAIFKKLWGYYKAMAIETLQFIYNADELYIWGEDHHKKSQMLTKINTKNVNHYYCGGNFEIGVTCAYLEKIMMTIDKTHSSASFVIKKGYDQKLMRISFSTDIEIDKTHTVELAGEYSKLADKQIFFDDDYTIKFELPGKYFKKMISDMKGFSEQITLMQNGKDQPLIFEYITKDKKIKSEDIVRNNKLVKFASKLSGDETFRTSFKIDYVKPISSALLGDNITIYVHEFKPLMFSVDIDNGTIEIRILSQIIDERNKN